MTGAPLVAAFERLVRRDPQRTLVIGRGRQFTAADVAALAAALDPLLSGPAFAPGRIAALQAPNGAAFLAGLVAMRRRGLVVALLDARMPQGECERTLVELGGRGLLRADDRGASHGQVLAGDDPPAELGGTTAVLKLSSGSTGAARGILTPENSLLADDAALTASMGIRPADRLLATVPFSHSYGLSSLVVPALVRGTTLVVVEDDGPFAPLRAARLADATVFPTVPAYLGALLRLSEPGLLPPSLRLIVSAGAPLAPETARAFREAFGLAVHAFYGASECGGICFDREGGAAERGSVGEPVEGVGVDVQPLDDGSEPEAGRVVVRSAALAAGYHPRPDARLDGRRYVTDDLARWRNGGLELVGRMNDLVNVRGRKVNPREVERILLRLRGVDDVVATAGGDDPGAQYVRAAVACADGLLSRSDIIEWCRAELSDHKVPRRLAIVPLIPRNERGKVDQAALEALFEDAVGVDGPHA